MESRPAGLVAPADVDEGQRGRGEDGVSSVNRVVFIFSVVFCPPPHGHHLLPDHVGCRSVEHVEGQFCRLDRELFIETCHSVLSDMSNESNVIKYTELCNSYGPQVSTHGTWDRQSGSAGEGQNGLESRLWLHTGGVEAEAQGRQRPLVAPGRVETWNKISIKSANKSGSFAFQNECFRLSEYRTEASYNVTNLPG